MGNKDSKDRPLATPVNQPKLKKADLLFLKENTTFDEETISEWYTEFLVRNSDFLRIIQNFLISSGIRVLIWVFWLQRDCQNGKLSPKKFMEVYQVICPGGEAEAFAQHVFRTFDKDKNGFIDFKVSYLPIDVD